MRFRDIIALLILVIVAVGGQLFRSEPDSPAPPPPSDKSTPSPYGDNPRRPAPQYDGGKLWSAETRDWLSEAPSTRPGVTPDWIKPERQLFVDLPQRRTSGSGTAFAVGDGKWLTARHVIDGCDDIGLQTAPGKGVRVTNIRNHPNADVALLTTRQGPTPFPLGNGADTGDDGYFIGFPQGKPGAVHARKIGTTTLQERGRFNTRERADVWSEKSRIPDRFGSLGDLSGGPAFTADGRLTGVVLAEEPRRGRVLTAEPATLRSMIADAGGSSGRNEPARDLSADDYPKSARGLLTSLRITKVLCRVR